MERLVRLEVMMRGQPFSSFGPHLRRPNTTPPLIIITATSCLVHRSSTTSEAGNIMTSMQTAPAVLISGLVSDVARHFLSLVDALTAELRFASQVSPTAVQDEFTRFKVSSVSFCFEP